MPKLLKIDQGFAVTLESSFLKSLGIGPDSEVEVKLEGFKIIITRATKTEALEVLAMQVMNIHDESFKKLS